MQMRDFIYWLQGFAELSEENNGLTPAQWDCVKRHLGLVFHHEIDPTFGAQEVQKALDKIHQGEEHVTALISSTVTHDKDGNPLPRSEWHLSYEKPGTKVAKMGKEIEEAFDTVEKIQHEIKTGGSGAGLKF